MARRRKRRRGLGAARTGETFVARAFRSNGVLVTTTDPAASPAIAMQRAQGACNRLLDVVVRGEYTSDGTFWPDHRGRVVAVCENKRWRR